MFENMNGITDRTIKMWNDHIKKLTETKDIETILSIQTRLYGIATTLWTQETINYKQFCILEETIEKLVNEKLES